MENDDIIINYTFTILYIIFNLFEILNLNDFFQKY
jgi:hypothetical protein